MLEVKKLIITYKETGQKVLDGISFKVKKGEIVAIMGPSGCGKTTLLSAIQNPKNNSMDIKGDIILGDKAVVRSVFQEPRLLPWKTALENIRLSASNKDIQFITEDIEKIGLSGVSNSFPSELSLGMQHRINFLRACASGANVILLDEPFASLDKSRKTKIIADFKAKIKESGVTTIFVTHNEDDARALAGRIIYFSNKPTKILKEIDNV